jgi:hypothetical protein
MTIQIKFICVIYGLSDYSDFLLFICVQRVVLLDMVIKHKY